jgi:hypothetical protein
MMINIPERLPVGVAMPSIGRQAERLKVEQLPGGDGDALA